jgi:hypothetical protein
VIVAGKSMLNNTIDAFVYPYYVNVSENRYFILDNMREMLPEIAERTIAAYQELIMEDHNGLFQNWAYFVVVKSLLLILLYGVLYFLVRKFVYFTHVVSNIYCNILKWDAYELYMKCYKFRTLILQCTSKESENQRNNSDLLKVFPKSLLVMLTQRIDKKAIE